MEASTPVPPPPPDAAASPGPGDEYPVRVEITREDGYAQFMPLIKWLLALPHYIVLILLAVAVVVAKLIAAFAVLFTRRYPRVLFDFNLGVLRWATRVAAYVGLVTDRYPPFSLEPDPSFPVTYEIAYPEEVDRWRPFVHWLLAVPYLIIANALGNLAFAITVVVFFAILFTRRYPPGLFPMIPRILRWHARAVAYAGFMVTRYPPFDFDA